MYKLLLVTLEDLEEKHFKRFKRLLSHDLPEGFTAMEGKRHESLDRDDTVELLIETYGSDGSLRVTLHILKSEALQRNDVAQHLQEKSENVSKTEALWEKAQKKLKANLKGKYESIYHPSTKKQVPLKEIHTELLIIEGTHEGISFEHEVMLTAQASKMEPSQAFLNKIDEIFTPTGTKGSKIVMTTGISGIGKTITVQKFVLDWVEGNCNQIVQFTCVLPFRELNLMEDNKSFLQLIYHFHPEMQVIDVDKFKELKILLIFDGLDESKLPLDFAHNKVFSELDKKSSIDALLTNLIKGHLLEGSWIWITSRPAAAQMVPSKYIDRFTEIRGFNNDQKEEYFHKATQDDQELATRIISHIKSVRSLHIMCHIPMFCWISANVLKDMMMKEAEGTQTKIPRSLTEMYIHYLLIQICVKNEKYDGSNQGNPKELSGDDKNLLLALAELAFRQLQTGGILFEEDDVKACGIDVDTASLNSAMCTEILKIESGLYNKKMFCFVHLSIQELFAALHVFYEFGKTNRNLLCTEKSLRKKYMLPPHVPITFGKKEESDDEDHTYFSGYAGYGNVTTKFRKLKGTDHVKMESCNVFTSLSELHKNALDLALKSNTGHLDLFVRFLLGFSLEKNLTLLKNLWMPIVWNSGSFEDTKRNIEVTIKYIMHKIRGDPPSGSARRENHSPERLINLFHCLSELNHSSLQEEGLTALNSQSYGSELMAPHCSALAYILMTSDHKVFDLKSYNTHPEGHHRLMPVVKHCKTVLMDYGQIQLETYEAVAAVLSSANNCITELDLSNNITPGEGIACLCESGLKNPNCKLQILRLQRCSLTEKTCASLATAFSSDATKLECLSVSGNDLYDSGAKLLLSGLLAAPCKLQTLCLESCGLTWEVCEAVAAALNSAGSSLRELDLSSNDLRDLGVQRLCRLLGTIPCALQTLRLGDCSLTEACCFELASALRSAMSGLSYLDLMHNRLKDCGVQQLCTALKEPGCQLQKLGLSGCDVTDSGYGHLVSAICLNPACLRELDLGFEDKDDPRLKLFTPLLDDPSCRLEKVVLSQDRGTRRATLLQHVCPLTFDDKSMCLMLSLSEDNRTVSCTERCSIDGPTAHHPERFAHPQVLCREGLTGRCYWEAEWKGQACYIGLTAHSISRSGEECVVGYSNTSWCVMCYKNSYQLIHNKQILETVFTSGPSQRVGVFLDGLKGSISFYIVSKDAAQLLHQVHTDITEPLYPGFYVGPNTSVLLCQLE